jgi:hypothetical protein
MNTNSQSRKRSKSPVVMGPLKTNIAATSGPVNEQGFSSRFAREYNNNSNIFVKDMKPKKDLMNY